MLSQTILLTTSALVCATQEELTKEEELRALVLEYKFAETGNSWTVNATANGTSTENVIHLLQSKTQHNNGRGAIFLSEDGRFPKPDEDFVG
jgi:hypothetical protein